MKIRDIMSATPEYISPDTTLTKAAQMMFEHDHGFLPVGENDRLIGMVTDRDIAIRAVAQGWDPNSTDARKIMTEKVLYVFEDDNIERAAESMRDQQVRRLIVLNRDKRMTGVVSLGDLATRCGNDELCGETLEKVSEHAA